MIFFNLNLKNQWSFLQNCVESAVEKPVPLDLFMKVHKIFSHSNYFILQCADNVHTVFILTQKNTLAFHKHTPCLFRILNKAAIQSNLVSD